MNYEQANNVKELALGVNKVLERLEVVEYLKKQKGGIVKKWNWTPQVGEWCMQKIGRQTYLYLIRVVLGKKLVVEPLTLYMLNQVEVTPILGWEEIEGVLEKAGYILWESYSSRRRYVASINDKYESFGDSRQEAVMKAVLALGKELKQ